MNKLKYIGKYWINIHYLGNLKKSNLSWHFPNLEFPQISEIQPKCIRMRPKLKPLFLMGVCKEETTTIRKQSRLQPTTIEIAGHQYTPKQVRQGRQRVSIRCQTVNILGLGIIKSLLQIVFVAWKQPYNMHTVFPRK